MIRSNRIYSLNVTLKMRQQRRRSQKVRAGLRDLIYSIVFLTIIGLVIANIQLQQAGDRADKALAMTANLPPVPQVTKNIFPVIDMQPASLTKEPVKSNDRASRLRSYLQDVKSPLADYADLIVAEADNNDIGWTWTTGIACMESSCGLALPEGSFNAWGIMAWDAQGNRFVRRFSSWEEGIKYASSMLGTNYKQNMFYGIKTKYCPESDGCNPNWANIVTATTNKILSLEGKN